MFFAKILNIYIYEKIRKKSIIDVKKCKYKNKNLKFIKHIFEILKENFK